MAEEKKTVEVEGFGTIELVSDPIPEKEVDGKIKAAKPGVCKMSEPDLMKFYEKHGVPNAKTVMKAINGAREALAEKAAEFLTPKVKETGADWELRMGLGDNRIVFGVDAIRESRNVRTGDKITKYGTFWMKANAPCPINSDKFQALQNDIEKAMKKKLGL